ncbi:DMT family transporter [Lihuaxuella thermophila]|uniref:Permease of the drug/metabolite transporter (DMT) superfamily n=1 Tax=Lihuaxuella thermophila TaxID=1173111 RepID=A0A1H8E2S4_9BACL|nr:DMT family transporter [Lihuaxuella thermophila]SEN13068.1 Permease of the drug/metabolite transporter (DMT) superfamily [Lihuaxuella thermophila]
MVVMVAWGLNVIATKILVTRFPPVTMTAFRVFAAGLTVLLIQWMGRELRKLSLKETGFICFVALFNVVGHHYFLSLGLSMSTASNAGIILGLVPLVTTVLAVTFLKEKMTLLRFLGFLLGFAGVMLTMLHGSRHTIQFTIGDFYVLLAVVTQAVSFILIKKSPLNAGMLTGWMLVSGASALFLIGLFIEPRGLDRLSTGTWSDWLIFSASAIIATGLGHMTYNKALQKIGASASSVFINLTPFFSMMGAFFLLDEEIGWLKVTGCIFIVTGVFLGTGLIEEKAKKWLSSAKVSHKVQG